MEFGDRNHYVMQYVDQITGKKRSKSTKVERTGRNRERTEAERVAAQSEQDLLAGRYKDQSRVAWSEFRDAYEFQALPALADEPQSRASLVLNVFERLENPLLLRSVSTAVITDFQSKLRSEGKSEATIKSYFGHLRAALN